MFTHVVEHQRAARIDSNLQALLVALLGYQSMFCQLVNIKLLAFRVVKCLHKRARMSQNPVELQWLVQNRRRCVVITETAKSETSNVIYVVGQFLIPNLPLFVMSSLSCIVVGVSG